MTHYNLVHKFIPMPQAMKIPDAQAAVDKEWKKLEKSKSKEEVILEAQRDKKKVHFATLMDICHLKNAELEPQFPKCKGRVVLRGDIVRDDSGAYAVFTEQGSSASQMTAAKVMDAITRLPDCDGQAADAVPDCSEFQSHNVQMYGYVFHDIIGQTLGQTLKNRLSTCRIVRENSKKVLSGAWMGQSTELGMSICSSKTRIILMGVRG